MAVRQCCAIVTGAIRRRPRRLVASPQLGTRRDPSVVSLQPADPIAYAALGEMQLVIELQVRSLDQVGGAARSFGTRQAASGPYRPCSHRAGTA
jgi:hypothetical protein